MVDLEDTTIAEWRDVENYEGLYRVGSDGRIQGMRQYNGLLPGRTLALHIGNHGYATVRLSRGSRKRTVLVHAVVARAFLGERPDGHQVNHKDGKKLNNAASNLEYVTPSENLYHAVHVTRRMPSGDAHYYRTRPTAIRRGEQAGGAKLTAADVTSIRTRYAAGGIRQRDLADEFHVTFQLISNVIRRKIWKHLR